jgi:hypothetical protein
MKRVHMARGNTNITLFVYQPYGPVQLVGYALNGEWAHGLSSRYALDWRGADGKLIRHITGNIEQGPALTTEERGRAEESLQRDRKRIGQDPGFSIPSHKPPLRRIFFDTMGRLWVELSTPERAPRRAHIYDRSGQRVAEAEWPAEVDLDFGVVRGDTAWGVAVDSLGVQTLVRLKGVTN